MTRILVVDDEPQILRALGTNLRARGYDVDLAPTGEEALELAARKHPDLVIVDLGLPGDRRRRRDPRPPRLDGACRSSCSPSASAKRDKVAALDAGADDYVTKPFGMDELLARLRAALRRAAPAEEEAVVETDDFRVDLAAKRVERDGRGGPPDPDRVADRRDARPQPRPARHPAPAPPEVWGPQYEKETNYLRVYLAQIRRKLEPDPASPATSSPSPAWATGSSPDLRQAAAGTRPAGARVSQSRRRGSTER